MCDRREVPQWQLICKRQAVQAWLEWRRVAKEQLEWAGLHPSRTSWLRYPRRRAVRCHNYDRICNLHRYSLHTADISFRPSSTTYFGPEQFGTFITLPGDGQKAGGKLKHQFLMHCRFTRQLTRRARG